MTTPQHAPAAFQDVLLLELHHRFYNSLQILSAMTRGLVRSQVDSAPLHADAQRIQDRIAMLADLHRLLADPLRCSASLPAVCRDICERLQATFDRPDMRVTLSIARIEPATAPARGLILLLVELLTNAFKHGAKDGALAVRLVAAKRGYRLVVHNLGPGRTIATLPRVATELAHCLGGTLAIDASNGYEVRVILPR
jgi:two-component sensor histidine kinase